MAIEVEKITGPPGTGKTHALIERMTQELNAGLYPEEIAYYSFTRAAANEAKARAVAAFPTFDKKEFEHVRTIHSECFRLLGLSKDQVMAGGKLKEFATSFGYEFSRQGDEDNIEDFEVREATLKTLGDYLLFFEQWRRNLCLFDISEAYRHFWDVAQGIDGFTLPVALKFHERYTEYKKGGGLYDFEDMLTLVLEQGLRPNVKALILDEAQDNSPLQFKVIDMWLQGVERHYLAGDPFQCLPQGTLIEMANGQEVPIEDVQVGTAVLTATGRSEIGRSIVKNKVQECRWDRLVRIKTARGRELIATANHQLFAYIPSQGSEGHYVYLMYKSGLGWRIGICKNLIVRFRCEPTADYIIGIKYCDMEQEAIFWETYYSLKYGIPRVVFSRRGQEALSEEQTRRLFRLLNTESRVGIMATELGLNLTMPHCIRAATNQGVITRLIVNVYMCQKRERSGSQATGHPGCHHEVSLETSDSFTLDRLSAAGYKLCLSRRGCKRYRREFQSFEDAIGEARRIQKVIGGIINISSLLARYQGEGSVRVKLCPAGNILPGFWIPIEEKGEVVLDKVIDVTAELKMGTFYDLTIDRSANYIANGVVVHNSIYVWQGARPELFEGRAATKTTFLEQSFRVPRSVHSIARQIIKRDVRYQPRPAQGSVDYLEWDNIVRDIEPGESSFLLVRNRYLLAPLVQMLTLRGLPFVNLRGPGPMNSDARLLVYWLLRLKRGKHIGVAEMAKLLHPIPQAPYLTRGFKAKVERLAKEVGYLTMGLEEMEVTERFREELHSDAYLSLLKLSPAYQAYFNRLIKVFGSEVLLEQPKTYVGTIHAVKGMEAHHVGILPDMAWRTWKGYQDSPFLERCVWYVAVTRASESVALAYPQEMRHFPWPKEERHELKF